MRNLIIVRHGQSTWNAKNKFTGWVNAPLSDKGKQEAKSAGELIKSINLINLNGFTSFLDRAIETFNIIINNIEQKNVIEKKAWQLNERHYGSLTGLNKEETKKKIGAELFLKYRRSWDIAPPKIDLLEKDKKIFGELFNNIPKSSIPTTESLKDTYNRVVPYFETNIVPLLKNKKDVIIVAHGNSLRALCKKLFYIDEKNINSLEIPTGNPMHIIMRDNLEIEEACYLNINRAKRIINN